MEMAIGNAPWPIGVTNAGIHARPGRERIFRKDFYLTLSAHPWPTFRPIFQSALRGGGVKLNFLIFFFIEASATKRFAISRIFRYVCLMIILSNRQKEREGGGAYSALPHGLRG